MDLCERAKTANCLADWNIFYSEIEITFNKKQDVLVALAHFVLLKLGFNCIGVGENKTLFYDECPCEGLPFGWNEMHNYTLRYMHSGQIFVLVGYSNPDCLILNLYNICTQQVSSLMLHPSQLVRCVKGPAYVVLPTADQIVCRICKELVQPVYESGSNSNWQTYTMQPAASPRSNSSYLTESPSRNKRCADSPCSYYGSKMKVCKESGGEDELDYRRKKSCCCFDGKYGGCDDSCDPRKCAKSKSKGQRRERGGTDDCRPCCSCPSTSRNGLQATCDCKWEQPCCGCNDNCYECGAGQCSCNDTIPSLTSAAQFTPFGQYLPCPQPRPFPDNSRGCPSYGPPPCSSQCFRPPPHVQPSFGPPPCVPLPCEPPPPCCPSPCCSPTRSQPPGCPPAGSSYPKGPPTCPQSCCAQQSCSAPCYPSPSCQPCCTQPCKPKSSKQQPSYQQQSCCQQPCCQQSCCQQPCCQQPCCQQPCCQQPCCQQPCCQQPCCQQPCCQQPCCQQPCCMQLCQPCCCSQPFSSQSRCPPTCCSPQRVSPYDQTCMGCFATSSNESCHPCVQFKVCNGERRESCARRRRGKENSSIVCIPLTIQGSGITVGNVQSGTCVDEMGEEKICMNTKLNGRRGRYSGMMISDTECVERVQVDPCRRMGPTLQKRMLAQLAKDYAENHNIDSLILDGEGPDLSLEQSIAQRRCEQMAQLGALSRGGLNSSSFRTSQHRGIARGASSACCCALPNQEQERHNVTYSRSCRSLPERDGPLKKRGSFVYCPPDEGNLSSCQCIAPQDVQDKAQESQSFKCLHDPDGNELKINIKINVDGNNAAGGTAGALPGALQTSNSYMPNGHAPNGYAQHGYAPNGSNYAAALPASVQPNRHASRHSTRPPFDMDCPTCPPTCTGTCRDSCKHDCTGSCRPSCRPHCNLKPSIPGVFVYPEKSECRRSAERSIIRCCAEKGGPIVLGVEASVCSMYDSKLSAGQFIALCSCGKKSSSDVADAASTADTAKAAAGEESKSVVEIDSVAEVEKARSSASDTSKGSGSQKSDDDAERREILKGEQSLKAEQSQKELPLKSEQSLKREPSIKSRSSMKTAGSRTKSIKKSPSSGASTPALGDPTRIDDMATASYADHRLEAAYRSSSKVGTSTESGSDTIGRSVLKKPKEAPASLPPRERRSSSKRERGGTTESGSSDSDQQRSWAVVPHAYMQDDDDEYNKNKLLVRNRDTSPAKKIEKSKKL